MYKEIQSKKGDNHNFCWQHQNCQKQIIQKAEEEKAEEEKTEEEKAEEEKAEEEKAEEEKAEEEKEAKKPIRLYDCMQSQPLTVIKAPGIEETEIYLKGNRVTGTFNTFMHSFEGIDYTFIVAIYYNEYYKKHMCNLYLNNAEENKNIISLHTENKLKYFAIEVESLKKYCVELMEKYNQKTDTVELWINYIQNCSWCLLPKIPNNTCNGLGAIFGLLYSLLSQIGYVGDIYLEDDSQFLANCEIPGKGLPTIPLRLFGGKKSIYESYGFVPVDENDNQVSYDELVGEITDTQLNFPFNNGELLTTASVLVNNHFKNMIEEKNRADYEIFVKTLYKFNHSQKQMGPMYKIRKIFERIRCTNYTLWACKQKK
jgi:hypothetical protein